MKILVTGGLGYIGSHTAVELSKNYNTVIVDNLINSDISIIDKINKISFSKVSFEKGDLTDLTIVKKLFEKHPDIKGVIHFAALKSVKDSVIDPTSYYHNNIVSLFNLLSEIKSNKMVVNFIFSSSATVYGEPENLPINEEEKIKIALSPYGNTKQICEEILTDFCKSNNYFNCISLRYFNPVGAHKSSEIGELPNGVPQNLVPYITQSAAGIRKELTIFGGDYKTKDGTCVRDYIHVVDLANAHICALNYLEKNKGVENDVFNIGTGTGTSVFEIIESFEKVTSLKVNYKIGARRDGDVASAYTDNRKAKEVLGWKSKFSLEDALLSAWNWEKKLRGLK